VLGDTVALVDVNGVAEVGVQNTPTMRTNRQGYALVPYLTPYRSNRIVLNTDHLGAEVDIDNSVALVVPRRGAIIKARFNATRSRKIIAHLLMAGGKAPPFGSQVTDADGTLVGVVGPGGQVLLGVAQQQTLLTTSWGAGPDGQCALRLPKAEPAPDTRYTTHQLLCEPMTAERSDESTQSVQEAST
jgi:outer membrane usher protein